MQTANQAEDESDLTGVQTGEANAAPTGGLPFRRVNRRQLLRAGLGLAGAAPLLAAATSGQVAAANTSVTAIRHPAAQAGKVTLRFMRFAGAVWVHDVKFVDEFMEANPNIVVEGEDVIYDEMFNKCLAQGATNDLADIFAGHNIWAPYLAYKGLSLQLDPVVESGGITKPDDFFPSVIADARNVGTDGKLFWIPTVVHPGGNAVIVFNMNLMNEAGVPLPENKDWTISDFEALIRKVAKPDEGILGTDVVVGRHPLYAQQYTRTWGTDPAKGSEDAWLLSRDGKKHQLDSPPVKEAMEWYHKLATEHLVPTSGEKAAMEGSGVDHFNAGMMATRAGTVGAPATLRHQIGDRFEVEAVLWPRGPHGHRGSCLSYNTQSIWSQTQHQEEAVKLLNHITGPEIAFWVGYEGQLHAMARRSAWFNPQLWERFPVMKDAAEWFDTGIDPFPQPWNLRFVEWQDAWNQETTAYFDGEETFDEMLAHTQPRCQGIIDLPRP